MQLTAGSRVFLKSGKKVYSSPAVDAAATFTNTGNGLADLGATATGRIFSLLVYANGQHIPLQWVELSYPAGKRFVFKQDVQAADGSAFTGGITVSVDSNTATLPANTQPAKPELLTVGNTGNRDLDKLLQNINGATNYAVKIRALLGYINANRNRYTPQQLALADQIAASSDANIQNLNALIQEVQAKAKAQGITLQLANPYAAAGFGVIPLVAILIIALVATTATAVTALWYALSHTESIANNTITGLASQYEALAVLRTALPPDKQQLFDETIVKVANDSENKGYAAGKPGLFGELGSTAKWVLLAVGGLTLYTMFKK